MSKINYYVIADTHFNHWEMQKLCNRPEDFEDKIHSQLMKLSANDVLIHLGDICIGKDSEMHEKYIKPLWCRKILVRGNHDEKTNTWYLRNGWDFVCESIVDNMFGKKILFSHKPISYDNNYDINIHGHLHNTPHRDGEYLLTKNYKQRLYACEDFHYKPMLVKHFVEDTCTR